MRVLKYFLVILVTALLCAFGLRWHYTGKISVSRDPSNNTFYMTRYSMFQNAPLNEGCTVFLGDSITDYANLDELLPGHNVINRGITGDTTLGLLFRLDEVIRHKPSNVFILIGTNDIAAGVSPEEITRNIREIITRLKDGTPKTKIYIQTILPIVSSFPLKRDNETINAVNDMLKSLASETKCELVDLNAIFSENGEMPRRYTFDGLHMNGEAARKWAEIVRPLL